MIVNPHVDVHTKTPNHRKTLRKRKKNNLLQVKRILHTEIEVITFSLVFTLRLRLTWPGL